MINGDNLPKYISSPYVIFSLDFSKSALVLGQL